MVPAQQLQRHASRTIIRMRWMRKGVLSIGKLRMSSWYYVLIVCCSGTHGTLRHPSPLPESACTTTDIDACRDTCLANPACRTFGYNAAAQDCQLLSTSLPMQVYRKKNLDFGTIFYNRNCFVQDCAVTQPSGP